jgi:hypothetical protein
MASLYPGAPAAVTASAVPAAPSNGTTAKKTTAANTTPPAAPFDWTAWASRVAAGSGITPADLAALTKTASARAASETAATIAGYHTDQQAARDAAARAAAQQGQLGLASSRYLAGLDLPGQTAADYQAAAAAQVAAAQGFQGGLQQTVTDAAQGVQRNLDALGSPQAATDQGQAAGNALYALGGYLPSGNLAATGLANATALRALPAQTLGYGQELAQGELAAGQAEAAKFNPDIVNARAGQAALAAKYLDSLSEQARQAGQDRVANLFKVAAIAQDQEAAAARASAASAKAADIDPAVSKLNGYLSHSDGTPALDAKGKTVPVTATGAAAKPYRYQDSFGREVQMNPDGTQAVLSEGHWTDSAGNTWRVAVNGKQTLVSTKPVTEPTPHTRVVTLGKQQWLVDTATGAKIQYIGPAAATSSSTPKPHDTHVAGVGIVRVNPDGTTRVLRKDPPKKPTKAPGPYPNLTKIQVVHLRSGIANAFYGVKEQKDADGKVIRAALLPLDYQAAIDHAVQSGYSRAAATKMANRFYMPGQRGRPGGAGAGAGATWGTPTGLSGAGG